MSDQPQDRSLNYQQAGARKTPAEIQRETRRINWFILASILCLLLLVGVIFGLRKLQRTYNSYLRNLADQRAIIAHSVPPTFLRMSEWASDPQRTINISYSGDLKGQRGYDDQFLSRTYPHPNDKPVATLLRVKTLHQFPTFRTPPPVFFGELIDAEGRQLAIAAIPMRLHASSNPMFVVVDVPRRTFIDAFFNRPIVSYGLGYTPISGPPGWNSEPVRIYAGQPVPGDKSRFTCKLETPTHIGRLEGQLLDADTGHGFKLNLTVHLDGPNLNPPTSQPTTLLTNPPTP